MGRMSGPGGFGPELHYSFIGLPSEWEKDLNAEL
jgi:hypothetical protein